MSRYRRVLDYVTTHPWAIQRETLDAMVEVLELRVDGGRLADDVIAERLAAARSRQGPRKAGAAGVVPIHGVIMPRTDLMTAMSGGTSVEGIRQAFRDALADDEVSRIVFDVDSPGGSVEGIPELAAEIRAARGQTPMTAIADYTAASAAYWLAAQADELVASPSAIVGSVGVYGVHTDVSGMNEALGVRPTYIHAGRFKVEGNPDAPLTDDARTHIQSLVDASYDLFVRDLAAGRGASQKAILEGYGEGRAFDPKAAQARGMVDRIATFDEVLASNAPRMRARRSAEAEAEDLGLRAELEAQQRRLFEFEKERRARLVRRPA
jgi:capsid assembly protease